MAIIDLFSILPSLTVLASGYRLLKIFRLFRTFKVFRVFKAFRYSKNITMILNVFKKQKDSLIGKFITMISAVLGIAIVALPAGIIIAGYQEELEEIKNNKSDKI